MIKSVLLLWAYLALACPENGKYAIVHYSVVSAAAEVGGRSGEGSVGSPTKRTLCWGISWPDVVAFRMASFSQRNKYLQATKITVREGLSSELRKPIADIALRRMNSKSLRQIINSVLDPYGIRPQSGSPGVAFLVAADHDLIALRARMDACDWFRIYDIVEAVHQSLARRDNQSGIPEEGAPHAPAFESEINKYLVHAGIGWKMVDGLIVTRGDTAFEKTVSTAIETLKTAKSPTAAQHLDNAISALSVRPTPNTSGAVAHSTNAVECVLGVITGQSGTLGEYLKKSPPPFPPVLKKGIEGVYGYACEEGARHGKEGVEPGLEEAEFVLATCAAVCTLLTKKHRK